MLTTNNIPQPFAGLITRRIVRAHILSEIVLETYKMVTGGFQRAVEAVDVWAF